MRTDYQKQLQTLHTQLIQMGALCETAIASATKALLKDDEELRQKAVELEEEITYLEREIEDFCIKLLIRQQPVASDLRKITVAQKIIVDMKRIGDQAADIAGLTKFMQGSTVKSDIHIGDMARAAVKMITESIDSFVMSDLEKAKAVILYDDIVDNLFEQVKKELIEVLSNDNQKGSECLDLLMIAKYLERIGDHAENIAWWVVYVLTGQREQIDDLLRGR